MSRLIAVLFLALCASLTGLADGEIPEYQTGLVKRPVSSELAKLRDEFAEKSEAEGWSFGYNVEQIGKYATGLKQSFLASAELYGESLAPVGNDVKLKSISLESFGVTLPPTKNQKNCGSCVYFAVTWAFEAINWLYGNFTDILSPKHLMNCSGSGYQCNGAYASGDSGVAAGLLQMGGLCSEKEYPYLTPYEQRCSNVPDGVVLQGRIAGYKEISPTPRDALAALHKRSPVLTTVGANGTFQAYDSGVYNACSQTPTNHQMVIIGLDCETSVDKDKNCVFDSKGNLPPGVGIWTVQNSWGEYGENGRIRIKVTDKSGRKCNRMGEEMVLLDTGLPEPVEGPTEFRLENSATKLRVVVHPGVYRAEDLKTSLTEVGF